MMPLIIAQRTYDAHKAFYDKIHAVAKAAGKGAVDPDAASQPPRQRQPPLTTIAKKSKAAVILLPDVRPPDVDGRRQERRATEQLLKVGRRGPPGTCKTFHV
jgi:hypothetical protein